jgi:hypothetical protein
VWRRLVDALADHGILYASYKLGEGERVDGGRLFRDHTPASLQSLVSSFPEVRMLACWQNQDLRPSRSESWVNALVQRRPTQCSSQLDHLRGVSLSSDGHS